MKFNCQLSIFMAICAMAFLNKPAFPAGTTSESANPFNEFMTSRGGVDLISGKVAFPYTLNTLKASNGMELLLSLTYSGNIETNVKARNDIAPTTWVGLGWAFGFGSIKCDYNGTVDNTDDSYIWISSEGIPQKIIKRIEHGDDKPVYFLEKNPYWKVVPHDGNSDGIIDGWELADESGKKYTYGNCAGIDKENNTVRYTFCWTESNYVGAPTPSASTPMPDMFPYQWDLASITDPFGNGFYFSYDQTKEELKVNSWRTGDKKYTKASYLSKIVSTTGEYAEFSTVAKDPDEYRDYRSMVEEPDGFIEFYETKKLDQVNIKKEDVDFENGLLIRSYKFCYQSINAEVFFHENSDEEEAWLSADKILTENQKKYSKSILTSITESDAAGKTHGMALFSYFDGNDYYEEKKKNTYADKSEYYFGSMKSVTYPQCGEVQFNYKKQDMNVRADTTEYLGDGWNEHPDIVFGNLPDGREYAIIPSYGVHTKANYKPVVYTWTGNQWNRSTIPFSTSSKLDQYFPTKKGLFQIGIYETDSFKDGWFCKTGFLKVECHTATIRTIHPYLGLSAYYWDERTQSFRPMNVLSKRCTHGDCEAGVQDISDLELYEKSNVGLSGDDLWIVDQKNKNLLIGRIKDYKNSHGYTDKIVEWESKKINWYEKGDKHDFIGEGNYKNIKFGKNFFLRYNAGNIDVQRSHIYLYYLDKDRDLKSEFFNLDGDVDAVEVQDDFVLIHTKDFWEQFMYTLRFDGTEWKLIKWYVNNVKKRCWDCDGVRMTTGDDFFAIYHTRPGNLTSYYWNGQSWINILDNKDFDLSRYGKKYGDVKAGNDFFVFNYPWKKRGRCNNWRKKERFKVYQWFGDDEGWDQNAYGGRIGLSEKSWKQYDVGRDYFAGINYRNFNNNYLKNGELNLNALTWDGSQWESSPICTGIKFTEGTIANSDKTTLERTRHRDDRDVSKTFELRIREPVIRASNNATGVILRSDLGNYKGINCNSWSFDKGDKWADNFGIWDDADEQLYLSHKVDDKFENKIKEFFVESKIVTDKVTGVKSTYTYAPDSCNNVYNVQTRSAMFEEVTVTLPGAGGVEVYSFGTGVYNQKEGEGATQEDLVRATGLKGKLLSIKRYNAEGPFINEGGESDEPKPATPVSSTVYTYQEPTRIEKDDFWFISYYRDPAWPNEMQYVRLSSITETVQGVKNTTEYTYDAKPVNSYPKTVTTINSDGRKIVTTTFACEKEPYSTMLDANLLTQPCQVIVSQEKNSGFDDWFMENTVTEWDAKTLLPKATWKYEQKKVRSLRSLPAEFDFTATGPQSDKKWKLQKSFTGYSSNGLPMQTENAKGNAVVSKYGHKISLPIATVVNAKSNECAFFTGDYDDGDKDFYDVENRWSRGGSELAVPLNRHFGERSVHVAPDETGPSHRMTSFASGVDYILSAWVYPVTVSAEKPVRFSFLDLATNKDPVPGDAMISDIKESEWSFKRRIISKDIVASLTKGAKISFLSENGSEFFVEDIRIYPKNANVTTTFYDQRFNLPIVTVDPSNNPSPVSFYDYYGRVEKTAKRNPKGEEKVLTSSTFYEMRCDQSIKNTSLAKVTVNDESVDLRNGATSLSITVPAYTKEAAVFAKAQSSQATVEINGQSNDCPCAPTVKLPMNGNITVPIVVGDAYGSSPRTYDLNILIPGTCWEELTMNAQTQVRDHVFVMAGQTPYLAGASPSTHQLSVVYYNSGIWETAGTGSASEGEVANIAMAARQSGIVTAFSDKFRNNDNTINHNGRTRVKIYSGGSWTDAGLVSATTTYFNDVAVAQNGDIYVAYVADRDGELAGSATEGKIDETVFIKRYNGGSWTDVGSNHGIPVFADATLFCGASKVSLAIADNGTPYMAWVFDDIDTPEPEDPEDPEASPTDNDGNLYVARFTGTQWQVVGEANTDPVTDETPVKFKLICVGSTPYIAYSGESTLMPPSPKIMPSGSVTNVNVAYWNSSTWTPLASNAIPGDANLDFDLFEHNGPAIVFNSVFNKYAPCMINYTSAWHTVGFPILSGPVKSGMFFGQSTGLVPYTSSAQGVSGKNLKVSQLTTCDIPILTGLRLEVAGTDVTLFPPFREYLRNYAAKLDGDVTLATLYATGVSGSSVEVNNQPGDAVHGNHLQLLAGWNRIPITVTINDNIITYEMSIYRPPNNFANICSFSLSTASGEEVDYTPEFAHAIKSYSATVDAGDKGINFYAEGTEGTTIKIENSSFMVGVKEWLPLKYGVNRFEVFVGSADAEAYTPYTLIVTRPIPNNLKLSLLQVSEGTLTPSFDQDITEYSVAAIPSATIQLKANAQEITSSVRLGSTIPLTIDNWSDSIYLPYGSNTFSIRVASADSEFINYRINITREPIDIVAINGLSVVRNSDNSAVTLSPLPFNRNVFEYSGIVESNVGGVLVNVTPADGSSLIRVGEEEWNGSALLVDLEHGRNVIPIGTISPDEESEDAAEYWISIYRDYPPMPTPKLSFDLREGNIIENQGGEVTRSRIKVNLSSPPATDVTVQYTVTGGTATRGDQGTANADYQVIGSGTLTFTPCEKEQFIELDIFDDEQIETNETIILQLSSPAGADLGFTTTHTLTIIDNDIPKVSFGSSSSSVWENVASGTATFSITLSERSLKTVEVAFGVTIATADEGDYTLTGSETFVFGPNDPLTKQISISIHNDTIPEGNEWIDFEILNLINAEYGSITTHTVTILDDEHLVTFNTQGGSEVPSQTVVHGAHAARPTDPTRNNYNFGGWYTESACINEWDFISAAVNSPMTLYAKWIPNLFAIAFNSDAGSGPETETSPSITVSIGAVPASDQTFTVDYAVTGGSATGGGGDYTLVSGTLSFDSDNTTRSIPLTIVSDEDHEIDETIVISLSNPTNGAVFGTFDMFTYTIVGDITASVIFVKPDGNDDNDGSSWGQAKATIGAALAKAATLSLSYQHRAEIRVASGTYRPLRVGVHTDIVMSTYVDLLGGFTDGGSKENRNWKRNETIISGDLENNDSRDWLDTYPIHDERLKDNAQRIIVGANFSTIDGLIIERAYANCTVRYPGTCSGTYWGGAMFNSDLYMMEVKNCQFRYNVSTGLGGGAVFSFQSLIYFDNCYFSHNFSTGDGGAVSNYADDYPGRGYFNFFTNCLFDDNVCNDNGGALYLHYNNAVITNCTFVNNGSKKKTGGGIYLKANNEHHTVHVRNSIFYNNFDTTNSSSAEVYVTSLEDGNIYTNNNSSLIHVRTDHLWKGNASENTTAPPLLTSDYHLSGPASPCYNSGYPEELITFGVKDASGNPIDLDNQPRFRGTIDMGAFEYNAEATLTGLASDIGTFSPIFNSGVMNYTLALPFETSSINLTATALNGSVTMFVNGTQQMQSDVPLTVGVSHGQAIVVETYIDGTLKDTYTIMPRIETDILYVRANITTSGDGRSWNTAYKYLGDALGEAKNNPGTIRQILVAAGTYYPDVVSASQPDGNDDVKKPFEMQPGVDLKGGYPANGGTTRDWLTNRTVLSGDIEQVAPNAGNYSVHVITGADATIDGFTIEWGKAMNPGDLNSTEGSGMLNLNCTPRIANCRFTNNNSQGGGALFFSNGSGTITIDGCVFEDNGGGAIVGRGNNTALNIKNSDFNRNQGIIGSAINYSDGQLTITGSKFNENYSGSRGGAIAAIYCGYFDISKCIFTQNSTGSHGSGSYGGGGAIFIHDPFGTTEVTISDTRFTSNQTAIGVCSGGAIFFDGSGKLTLTNCVLQSNSAPLGAGIYSSAKNNEIKNTVFYNNTGADNGGGIFIFNGSEDQTFINCVFADHSANQGAGIYSSVPATANFKIYNCTFYDNTATTGGGLYLGYATAPQEQPEIKNTIIWNIPANPYGAYYSGASSPAVTYSCIQDYQRPAYENNPGFINPVAIAGEDSIFGTVDDGLSLTLGALCFNTGDPLTDMSLLPVDNSSNPIDLAKRPRLFGTIDMGAYERQPTDNDVTVISFNPASASGDESAPNPPITVTASPAPQNDQTITINYTVSGGTATSGSDYTFTSGTLSFDPANTSRRIPLTIINDTVTEGNETVIITLSNPTGGGVLGTATVFTYAINDNDPPVIQLTSSAGSGLESEESPVITVSAVPAPYDGQTVSVNYEVTGGTATSESDYTLTSGTLNFDKSNTSRIIPVSIVNDGSAEGNESVVITLSGPTGGALLGNASEYIYTIIDDDRTVYFASASGSGSESQAAQTITVSVTPAPADDQSFTVDYSATGGTATGGGTDYTLLSGTLTFDAANPSRTISLTVINDAVEEADETVIISLASPSQGIILGAQKTHTYTILDNDRIVGFSSASGSGNESVTSPTIAVTLSTALTSGQTGTVQYVVTGGTATGSGTDYTLVSGTLSFDVSNSSRNIPLIIVNDLLNEASETVIITLSSPTNLALGSTTTYTYTITDNDPPVIAFTAANGGCGSESVTSPSPAITVTASPTPRLGQTFSVSYSVSGTATGNGTDYTLADGTLSFDAVNMSRILPLSIVNDALIENDETVIITLSSPTNGAVLGELSTFSYTIKDDDVPTIEFTSSSGSGLESVVSPSPAITVIVNPAPEAGAAASVNYTITGTATGNQTDYALWNGTLSFNNENPSRTISLIVIDDWELEADETVIITLSNPSQGYVLGAQSTYTYTIIDNDYIVPP